MAGLRVYGQTGFRVADVRDFLGRVEYAYNAFYTFEVLLEASFRTAEHLKPWPEAWLYWPLAGLSPGRARFLLAWPPTPETVAPVVPPRHRLILSTVRFESPGFWEFIGKLNPLEVIRQSINDRHERRKDLEYREQAEARRLQLENQLLENKVVRERLEIAKQLGATEHDLAPLLNELVLRPVRELEVHQEMSVIQTAELVAVQTERDER